MAQCGPLNSVLGFTFPVKLVDCLARVLRSGGNSIASDQCQGGVAACRGGWILIIWCLARSVRATFGLAFMRFVGTRCEGPVGVT